MNVLVESSCNQRCEFCFQRSAFEPEGRATMTLDEVRTVASFMTANHRGAVGVLGGEPTLHPEFGAIVREFAARGIRTTVFTNGLSDPARLEAGLPYVDSVLVNYATPFARNGNGRAGLSATLDRLVRERDERRRRGAELGIDLGVTLMEVGQDLSYVLRVAQEIEARAVRWDLAKPAPDRKNRYIDPFAHENAGAWIAGFVREFESAGVKTGVDCPVPLCLFEPEDLAYLEKTVLGFRGSCRPPVDVLPGLRLIHCLPLAHVCEPLHLSEIGSWDELQRFLYGVVRSSSWKRALPVACRECGFFREKRCQGYCPAFRISEVES